ncbi:keratin, type I cytoskeletal 19-like [Carcharodon carcharias]|uniref:keratin, type I cytoskeletal 19-like n=1 Tax=Carcharodon carcharias TaxID=13397 RepID=UPI001B7EB137|nr:keratin, type I cytoskeletal 19-like [Carcharodon carcharias]
MSMSFKSSFGGSSRHGSSSVRLVRSSGGASRAQSLYSVGMGTRIASVSPSSGLGSALGSGSGSFSISSSSSSAGGFNEKTTMQNLNERLSSYLDRVHSLETSNSKMELEIRQLLEKATPAVRDWSVYWGTIKDIRDQINDLILDNSRLMLQIDNSKLAAEDFKTKFEAELGIRMAVEGDINGLRTVLDDMTLEKSQLEMQIEGLKEELIYIRKNHEEELRGLRGQISGNVTVDVTAEQSPDLSKMLEEMRQLYDDITKKNKSEAEEWYRQQCATVQQEFVVNTEALQAEKSQVVQLRHTLQGLDMELQTQLSMNASLNATLKDTEVRYSEEYNRIQLTINKLEAELVEMRLKIDQHVKDYADLLDIKSRLEMEISTYRRLLEGGSGQVTSTRRTNDIGKIVVTEEIREPVITKRVKTVVEESINGQVVSSHTEEIDVN